MYHTHTHKYRHKDQNMHNFSHFLTEKKYSLTHNGGIVSQWGIIVGLTKLLSNFNVNECMKKKLELTRNQDN